MNTNQNYCSTLKCFAIYIISVVFFSLIALGAYVLDVKGII